MTIVALSLVLGSAVLHALWNFLFKRAKDKAAFAWLFNMAAVVIYAPVFAVLVATQGLPSEGWLAVVLSAIVHAFYFALLGYGYSAGDLSLVYPLARGTGPMLVPVWAILLLDERLSLIGMAGIAAVVLGVYTLHLKVLSPRGLLAPFAALRSGSTRFALLTGVTISIYSVVDKVGVSYFQPLVYMYLWTSLFCLLYAPFVLKRSGWAAVKTEWGLNTAPIVLVGFLLVLTYTMVLTAMQMSPVSYVAAAREVAVVIGAAMGTLLLKEPYGRAKLSGAGLIAVGIALIAQAK